MSESMEVEMEMAGTENQVAIESAAEVPSGEQQNIQETSQEPAIEAPQESVPETNGDDVMNSEQTEETNSASEIRANAIFLTGVNTLTTKDVENFIEHYYESPFYIEWIDDDSVNIVYDDPEDAYQALVAITSEIEFANNERIEPSQLRSTRAHPKKTVTLSARFSTLKDKKTERSREKSRFYLINGAPSRKEDRIRFGSDRSKPLKYGTRNIDLLPGRKSSKDDLFPEKLKPTKKIQKALERKRGRKGKSSAPDLFAHLARDNKAEKPSTNTNTSIYSNMDY